MAMVKEQRTAKTKTRRENFVLFDSLSPAKTISGGKSDTIEGGISNVVILIPKPTDLKQGSKVRGIVHIVGIVGAEQQHQ